MEEAVAWDYPVNPPSAGWSWVNGVVAPPSNPLNPGPTPPAPKGGLDVKLSTGPDAQRTHWQYVFALGLRLQDGRARAIVASYDLGGV